MRKMFVVLSFVTILFIFGCFSTSPDISDVSVPDITIPPITITPISENDTVFLKYSVTGTSGKAAIAYTNALGSVVSAGIVTLPWTKNIGKTSTTALAIGAKRTTSGDIKVEIYFDDKLKTSKSGSGTVQVTATATNY